MRSNSITSLSSISSLAEAEETMQVFIKNLAGDIFPITIPTNTTVSTLRSLLALRTNMPEHELRLIYAGKHLGSSTSSSPSSSSSTTTTTTTTTFSTDNNASLTLAACNVRHESTLHLALPLRGGAPKKVRCNFKDCRDAAQRIVGDCGFCAGHFCGKHRMLESHACPGLEDCKKEEKDRNREKLESERTVAIRGI